MAKAEDRISGIHGGRVPLRYWQKSFLIDIVPDKSAPYMVRGPNNNWYIETGHPEYTRWLVGFVKGAANAIDATIKRQMN